MKIKRMMFSNSGWNNWLVYDDTDTLIRIIDVEQVIKYKIKNEDDVKKYMKLINKETKNEKNIITTN